MTSEPRNELSVLWPRAILLECWRGRKHGQARFRCMWDETSAKRWGWREPEGNDDVRKSDTFRATCFEVRQSKEEIYPVGKQRVAMIEQIETMLVDTIRLVRRQVEPNVFLSTVYLTVHFSKCPDALEQLEQFITCVEKPPSLKITYLPRRAAPAQPMLPDVEKMAVSA